MNKKWLHIVQCISKSKVTVHFILLVIDIIVLEITRHLQHCNMLTSNNTSSSPLQGHLIQVHSLITWSTSYNSTLQCNIVHCNSYNNHYLKWWHLLLAVTTTSHSIRAGVTMCLWELNTIKLYNLMETGLWLTFKSLYAIFSPQSLHSTSRYRHSFFKWSSSLASNTLSPHPVFLHSTVMNWQLDKCWSCNITTIYNSYYIIHILTIRSLKDPFHPHPMSWL